MTLGKLFISLKPSFLNHKMSYNSNTSYVLEGLFGVMHSGWDFPGGSVVCLPSAGDAGDAGLIPESGRSPGVGSHSSMGLLGNLMDRGAWCAAVHGIAKRWTQPGNGACMHT